jgi:acetolactate synthase-1/2/3 large subunit
MQKVSDLVISYIASLGVRHVFMLPGGGSMHLVDSLGHAPELTYVVNLHEQACAVAAEAYAQYTNHLGVALVTTGPGGTNTVTGVAAAWLDSTPCLFLSGQVKREDLKSGSGVRQFGFQEIDIVEMVRGITKYAVTVTEPAEILYELQKAVHLATTGRPGPVWVDIPLDVQGAAVDEVTLRRFRPDASPASDALPGQVGEAIRLLNGARRPVVLVGNGVRLAKAEEDLRRALALIGVPVLTTWKALDLIRDDDPLYCGRPGAIGQRGANFAQQTADWILTLGARLDLGQTGYSHENFAPRAKKVIVDVDPAEIRKLRTEIAVPIAADAGDFLRELNRQSVNVAPVSRAAWVRQCRDWTARYPVLLPDYWSYSDGVSLYVLVEVISELLEDGDLFVPGSSGACSEVSMQAFQMRRNVRVLNSQGIGAMGMGIPAVIGACLAAGGRRTVSMDGDGGFWMNIQDLETVRRLNLPAKLFVLNNNGYGSIRATQTSHFGGFMVGSGPDSGLTLPDVGRVCSAFGVEVFRLTNHEDIRARVREVLQRPGPAVCEVMVSPQQATSPRLASQRLPDGRMASKPLEDLWPYLDRDELHAIMAPPAGDRSS